MIRTTRQSRFSAPKSRNYRELLGPALLMAGAALCFSQKAPAAAQWGQPAPSARQNPAPQKPFGVQAQFDGRSGAMIIGQVVPGSVAARAGIKAGDSIVGGADARGQQVDFARTGPQGFGALVGQDRFTLFVYRRGVAEDRPMQVRVSRAAPQPKPQPERRGEPAPRREQPVERSGGQGGGDSRWIGSGGSSEDAPATGGERGSRGSDARGSAGATSVLSAARKSSAAPQGSLEMRRHVFRDQGFGGMASHVMLIPKGWQVEGGTLWTPNETIVNHFLAVVDSGDGKRITFDRARSFSYSQDPFYVQAMRQQGERAMQSFLPPPQRVGEAAMTVLMRVFRPQASDVRLVEAMRDQASEEVFRRMTSNYGLNSQMTVQAAVLSYEENGQRYEELFWYPQTVTRMPGVAGSAPLMMWALLGAVSYRAPAGKLQENFAQLAMIAQSRKATPRWSLCKSQLLQEISRIRHKGHTDRMAYMRQSSARIAKTYSEISDSQMASWRRQQAMKDEGHKKSVNGIAGVHDYQSRDGYSFALDHGYDHVLEHKDGRIFMTNDVSLADKMARGGDFDRMKRIR